MNFVACTLLLAVLGADQRPWPTIAPTESVTISPGLDVSKSISIDSAIANRQLDEVRTWVIGEQKAGRSESAVRRLSMLLGSPDSSARWLAARMLPLLGTDATPAISKIYQALDDPDEMVRWAAADALRVIAVHDDHGISLLFNALDHRDPLVRWSAVQAIGEVGPKARRAAPVLVQLLQDDHVVVRREAARALKSVLPQVATIGMAD